MGVFEDWLRATGRSRVRIDELRGRFLEARPELANAPDLRRHLLDALRALEAFGVIELPGRGWDRSGVPPLPRTVRVLDRPPAAPPPGPYAWLPELAFAAAVRHPGRLADLKAVNEFLKAARGKPMTPVPTTERSLQIFGDEKRLDALRRGRSELFEGRLTLSDLDAYAVAPPLPYETPRRPAQGRPVLVLENHHSYESFRRWNREGEHYAAVAYGGGWAFRQAAGNVDEIVAQTRAVGVLYLGDLDPTGIEVLAAVNADRSQAGLPTCAPHCDLYRWLLEHGIRCPLVRRPTPAQRRVCSDVLGEDFGREVLALWDAGFRVPQESYGTEQLGPP